MKTGTLSLRVSRPIWEIDERFEELVGMLKRHPKAFDEIALFTSFTHPPLTQEVLFQVAKNASKVIPVLKDMGYACGINMLSTVGHHEENLEYSLDEPWQRMMDIEGNVSRGSYCPLDPGLRGYISKSYKALTEAGPDFLWIDDDVRLEGHMPVVQCCFCDRCLERFSEETGRNWTRESLKTAINSTDAAESFIVRKAWLRHNNGIMWDVMNQVRVAVDSVNPGLPVGLMCGESFYNGYGFGEWLEELSRDAQKPGMLRPGGGFYTDATPIAILQKAHSLGRQTAEVAKSVVDIQSEIECFPYARLGKSIKMTCTEAAVYIANGCTGTAFNIMGSLGAPIPEYEAFLVAIEKYRDFYEVIADTFQRSDCEGMWQLSCKDLLASENLGSEWFAGAKTLPVNGQVIELASAGIPIATSQNAGALTFITGTAPLAFSKEEIEKVLSGGVMMDGAALECLTHMGFGDLLGFKVAGKREDDTVEELTDDPINAGFAGWHRDCRQSFKWWVETAYLLEPIDPTARVTSKAVDFELKGDSPISGLYENRLGGRIAVFGYFPWSFTGSLVRSTQLKRTSVWLSNNKLPGYVETYDKVAIWCRRNPAGKRAAFLLNMSFDSAIDLKVRLTDAPEKMTLHTPFNTPVMLTGEKGADGYTTFTIPELGSWDMAMIS